MVSKLKIGDRILIASIIIFSLLAMGIKMVRPNKDFKELVIKVDGQVQMRYQLKPGSHSDFYQIVPYKGYNKVEIQGDRVRMVEADCDDQVCVLQGWISKPGETILCLPHRVSVSLVGDSDDDLDHVNY